MPSERARQIESFESFVSKGSDPQKELVLSFQLLISVKLLLKNMSQLLKRKIFSSDSLLLMSIVLYLGAFMLILKLKTSMIGNLKVLLLPILL